MATVRSGVQVLGHAAVADEINARLGDSRYRVFRFAVAFARWSGLHLIDAELRAFTSRARHRMDGFVGIDLGGTTIEALTYLSEMPNSRIRVVRSGMSHVVFHPKVYAFEGPKDWVVVVGSSNLTTGGLHSNIESYLVVEGTPDDHSVLEALFSPYEQAPFSAAHVRDVDAAYLREIAADLDHYTTSPPDRQEPPGTSSPGPLDPDFDPPTPLGRPPEQQPPGGAAPPVAPPPIAVPVGTAQLYMELWDETGGGTQVQIAKQVFTDYFGAGYAATTYVTLDTPGGQLVGVRLQWFGNVTFRIGLPFVGTSVAQSGRRGVLRFTRTSPDHYRVELRLQGHPQYNAWLRRCDFETGQGHKHWGIH
jgi:HKD family nuclease